MILCRRIDSPVGPLMLAADDAGLRHIEFRDNRHPADRTDWHGGEHPILQTAETQLAEYFAVSEEKLKTLPAEKLAELRDNGALGQIYAHLVSLLGWDRLIAMAFTRAAAADAPVAANA